MRLFGLENRRLKGDFMALHSYAKSGCREKDASLFFSVTSSQDVRKWSQAVLEEVQIGYPEVFNNGEGDQALKYPAQGSGGVSDLGGMKEMCGCGTKEHGLYQWVVGWIGYSEGIFQTKWFYEKNSKDWREAQCL